MLNRSSLPGPKQLNIKYYVCTFVWILHANAEPPLLLVVDYGLKHNSVVDRI